MPPNSCTASKTPLHATHTQHDTRTQNTTHTHTTLSKKRHRTHTRITKAANTTRILTYIRVALQSKRTYCQEQMQTQTLLPMIASNRTVKVKRQRLFGKPHYWDTSCQLRLGQPIPLPESHVEGSQTHPTTCKNSEQHIFFVVTWQKKSQPKTNEIICSFLPETAPPMWRRAP